MTRSPEAKAWDVLVRAHLGERGWKVTAGGHGTRRTETNELSSSLRHDKAAGLVRGSVHATPLAFEAVARDLERATHHRRRTVVEPPRLASAPDVSVACGDDLAAAVAVAAEELHRRSVDLDEQYRHLDDYEPLLDRGQQSRLRRLLWHVARGDTDEAVGLARAWIGDPEHVVDDLRRPSPRSLPQHVLEWLAPVPITHGISSPDRNEHSSLPVPWTDVPSVLAQCLRRASRGRSLALIVWPVPDGTTFSPTMDVPGSGYLQTLGAGREWTIEVNRVESGRPCNFVVGRFEGDPDPALPDVEIPWHRHRFAIRPHECFEPGDVVDIVTGFVEHGDVDPGLGLRRLPVP